MRQTLTFEKVTDEFVPAVTALADKLAFSNSSEEERQQGFLLPYTEDQYRDYAKHAEYFFVLRLGKQVIGFVLAHSSEKIDLFGGEIYLHMRKLQTQPFIVGRQVGIAREFSHKGYARKLYNFLFKYLKKDIARYPTVMGFIWKHPPNPASEKFHRALGWKELETYHLKSGEGAVGIWERTIASTGLDASRSHLANPPKP